MYGVRQDSEGRSRPGVSIALWTPRSTGFHAAIGRAGIGDGWAVAAGFRAARWSASRTRTRFSCLLRHSETSASVDGSRRPSLRAYVLHAATSSDTRSQRGGLLMLPPSKSLKVEVPGALGINRLNIASEGWPHLCRSSRSIVQNCPKSSGTGFGCDTTHPFRVRESPVSTPEGYALIRAFGSEFRSCPASVISPLPRRIVGAAAEEGQMKGQPRCTPTQRTRPRLFSRCSAGWTWPHVRSWRWLRSSLPE